VLLSENLLLSILPLFYMSWFGSPSEKALGSWEPQLLKKAAVVVQLQVTNTSNPMITMEIEPALRTVLMMHRALLEATS